MPLKIKFPLGQSRDRKNHTPSISDQRRASSEEDRPPQQFKCPNCSYSGRAGASDDQTRTFDPLMTSMGFDFAPIPIFVISPNSNIESANRPAVSLFSHLAKVYGSLSGLHIGELGVEFQDQRWVTLGMLIEKKRQIYMEGNNTKAPSPTEASYGSPDYPDASSPSSRSRFPHSPDIGGFGRRAADALKGKHHRQSKSSDSDSNGESFEVMIRFPTSVSPAQANNRRESFGRTPGRRPDEMDKSNTVLVPATLFISFVDSGRDVYTTLTVLTHDSLGISTGAAKPVKSRELITPGNLNAATEFASQTERVRDATLENLDTQFIAMNARGDITMTNSSTRRFFGMESNMPNIGIGRTTSDWVSRLQVYDPKFSGNGTAFTEYFLHNFRRRTTPYKDNVGVYVKNQPRLMEISGLPLYAVNTPWVKDLDRELVGYLTMFRDITKQREIDATQQQDERLRGIFTSGVVSELRTPIAGIVGLLQILNETKLSQEQATHLMGLLRSVNYLLISIDDIVDFSSFEMRQTVMKARPFNLFHLIHHVSNLAYLTFSKRDVQFTMDFEGLKAITKYKYDGAEHDKDRPLDERMECVVIGDEWNARRVLTNILSNAFKYTSEGYVSLKVHLVSTQATTSRICFEVKDTGIGISEDAGKHIFKPFAEDDQTGRKPTDGLGLYVTQKIVKQLGGDLDFFSTLGIGTVFKLTFPFQRDPKIVLPDIQDKPVEDLLQATSLILQKDFTDRCRVSDPLSLRLPESDGEEEAAAQAAGNQTITEQLTMVPETSLVQPSPPEIKEITPSPTPEEEKPAPIVPSILKKDNESVKSVPSISGATPKKRPQYSPAPTRSGAPEPHREHSRDSVSSARGAPVDIKGVKVMVVEDNWALQNITKLRLEKLGCEPIIAANGIDALRLLGTGKADPALILMDLQMPLMDGYDTTKNIRSVSEDGLKEFQYIPIIAVTASTLEEDKEKAFKVGMSDYVFKPLGMNVIRDLVTKYGVKQKAKEAAGGEGDAGTPGGGKTPLASETAAG